MHPDVIAAMSREGIPVVGHAGLVPQKHRLTGLRAVGRSVAEARAVMATIRAYRRCRRLCRRTGMRPRPVATAIARATPLTIISMGSGPGCDVQYLFATDVLGETKGRVPRHARVYDDFAAEYARLHDRRVTAFTTFAQDVAQGRFPAPHELVPLKPEEEAALADFLADPPPIGPPMPDLLAPLKFKGTRNYSLTGPERQRRLR